jgi:hypothetical protein
MFSTPEKEDKILADSVRQAGERAAVNLLQSIMETSMRQKLIDWCCDNVMQYIFEAQEGSNRPFAIEDDVLLSFALNIGKEELKQHIGDSLDTRVQEWHKEAGF